MKATIIALTLLTISITAHADYEKVSEYVGRKTVYQQLSIERLEQDLAAVTAHKDNLLVMVNDDLAKIAQIEADIAGITERGVKVEPKPVEDEQVV